MMYDASYFNHVGGEELMRRLADEVLLVQGPMGSILMQQEGAEEIPPAYWNIAEPQTVSRIHQLYAAAGAQVLVTNTFQASAPCLERDEIFADVREVNRAAVDAARAAEPQLLVGSMGPCGLDWTYPDSAEFRLARETYRDQAYALLASGVDALLLETFTSIRDLEPALVGALDVADGMPVLVSFAINENGDLLGDGLSIEGAVVYAEKHGASAVGVNCCSIGAATAAVPRAVRAARTPVMVRPSAGMPEPGQDGGLRWEEDTDAFAEACATWVAAGARLVGSCCGATPLTTAALAEALES